MEFGRFFSISKTSRPEHKEVRFEYTEFRSGKGKKFPIYLVFQDDHINFYFNGYVRYKGKDELVETKLFSLHLHNDKQTQKELEQELKKLYTGEFPIIKEYEVISANREDDNPNNEIKNYKNLEVFSPGNKTNKILYKNLILDFLQDFNHSDVFDHCPQFSKIKHLIKESPFLNAIASKANFYYLIENYNKNEIFNFKEKHYTINLIKVQEDFLSILQNENNYHFLKKGNRWFENTETETRKVFKYTNEIEEKINFNNLDEKNKKDNFLNIKKSFSKNRLKALEWFIGRNNIYRAWTIHPKFKKLFITFGFFILGFILLFTFNILFNFSREYYTVYFATFSIILLLVLYSFKLNDEFKIDNNKEAEKKQKFFKNFSLPILFVINKIFKFLKHFVKLINIPLIILLFGSSFLVFEISSFYNNNFIHNGFSYLFSISLTFTLTFTFIYKLLRYTDFTDCMTRMHWFNALSITILLYSPIFFNLKIYVDFENIFSLFKIFIPIIVIIFGILYYNDKENHPNLSGEVTKHKTFSMLFYGLVISLFVNTLMYNGYYKEFLERYNYLGEMWEEARDINKKNNHQSHHKKQHNEDLEFIYTGNQLEEIKEKAKQPLSDEVSVYIDNHFYPELKNLYVAKKVDNSLKLLFPVLKEIKLPFGIKLTVIPSVLFINTFLSLLLAVILQILFHKRKFLLGGEAE